MSDQANMLRDLMDRRRIMPRVVDDAADAAGAAFSVAVAGGKGGVGKSHLALNLAVALAKLGHAVGVIDAGFGAGHVELMCGLSGYWNLSHVLSGARRLDDVLLDGPAGVRLVPGAGCLYELDGSSRPAADDLCDQLDAFQRGLEFVILDTACGLYRPVRQLAGCADLTLLVTTPEATSVADAYAMLKGLTAAPEPPAVELLVNLAESPAQADAIAERMRRTAGLFLRADVEPAGSVPRDPSVPAALSARNPFVIEAPQSPAARAVGQLARRVLRTRQSRAPAGRLLDRVRQRPAVTV
jgi:flagellar biosynthesis protein FlhG